MVSKPRSHAKIGIRELPTIVVFAFSLCIFVFVVLSPPSHDRLMTPMQKALGDSLAFFLLAIKYRAILVKGISDRQYWSAVGWAVTLDVLFVAFFFSAPPVGIGAEGIGLFLIAYQIILAPIAFGLYARSTIKRK